MRLLPLLALCLPLQAQALPIVYDITFDSINNFDGVGSFNWDDETLTISNFGWDFGEGRTGGFFESLWQRERGPGEPSWSIHMFELVTGEDADPSWNCADHIHWCSPPFASGEIYGWPVTHGGYISEWVGGAPGAFHGMLILGHTGTLSWSYTAARRESVPEPGTLLLLSSALAGIAITRRRRSANS